MGEWMDRYTNEWMIRQAVSQMVLWLMNFRYYILHGFLPLQSDAESHSLFTGEEEMFAFDRTISRLVEMQTEEYWNTGTLT